MSLVSDSVRIWRSVDARIGLNRLTSQSSDKTFWTLKRNFEFFCLVARRSEPFESFQRRLWSPCSDKLCTTTETLQRLQHTKGLSPQNRNWTFYRRCTNLIRCINNEEILGSVWRNYQLRQNSRNCWRRVNLVIIIIIIIIIFIKI